MFTKLAGKLGVMGGLIVKLSDHEPLKKTSYNQTVNQEWR
jgi:hypothetical protein